MSLADINKAVTAGATAGAAIFWQTEPTLGGWHALAPAIVAAVVIGFLTWAVPNGKVADLALVARQIEAALHIQQLVAKTSPTATVVPAPGIDDTTVLPIIK